MCTIVGGRGVGFVFHGGWGLFTSEFVGGQGSIVPLGHRTLKYIQVSPSGVGGTYFLLVHSMRRSYPETRRHLVRCE